MLKVLRNSVFFWLVVVLPVEAAVPRWVKTLTVWKSGEMRSIDGNLKRVEGELEGLPKVDGVNSSSRRGFQTGRVKEDESPWIELELAEAAEVDRVVLVPMLARGAQGAKAGLPGYGFPKRFQLEAIDDEGEIFLLLDETGEDFENPGLYPVSVEVPSGVKLARLRLVATVPWEREGQAVLALSEIFVLRGNRNFAAEGRVTASSSREMPPTWSRGNLNDWVTTLGLPVSPDEGGRIGWQSEVVYHRNLVKEVVVDLGGFFPVEELRVMPAGRKGVAVWAHYGFPTRYMIEVARERDFSDSVMIADHRGESVESSGQNVQSFTVKEAQEVRYVRMTATRLRERAGDYVFALGEVEAYVGDENVALGAEVLVEESLEDEEWGRAGLTDGMVAEGRLMGLSPWFDGVERRRVLEGEVVDLKKRRALLLARRAHVLITGSIALPVGISALAGLIVWRSRRQQRQDRERHRERLARDLHDELGSNLGSIALISSFAAEGESDEAQMREDLLEIERVARESADSMRDMVEMLGGGQGGAGSNWLGVMAGLAKRLLRGVELDCRLPDGPMVQEPDLETRREIYLFCKEVLYNVARHAEARKVSFWLKSRADGLVVEITDDGCGFDPELVGRGYGLGNLRERVAGLDATMSLESCVGNGTVVKLEVPRGRRWRKSKERENL